MRVALKTEFAPAKLSPQKQSTDRSHNRQRNGLLPIHAGNIPAKTVCATDFRSDSFWWGEAADKPSPPAKRDSPRRGRLAPSRRRSRYGGTGARTPAPP